MVASKLFDSNPCGRQGLAASTVFDSRDVFSLEVENFDVMYLSGLAAGSRCREDAYLDLLRGVV